MRLVLFIILTFVTSQAFGKEICARKFNAGNLDPCATSNTQFFRYIEPIEDSEDTVCTKIYEERYCEDSPAAFRHVLDTEKNVVCTVNFHSPPQHQYCDTSPNEFKWVLAHDEE